MRAASSSQPTTVYTGRDASFQIKKLLPGVSYAFKVRATNVIGTSEWSAETEACTLAAAPDAPAQPQLVHSDSTKISVLWRAPDEDNGAPIETYVLDHDQGEDGGFVVAYNGPGLECTVSVFPGSQNKFRVRAVNSVGTSPYSTVLVAEAPKRPPLAPCAPVVSGDVIFVSGDVIFVSGDVIFVSGDVIFVSGDVIFVSGDVIFVSGDVILVSGDVILVSGDVILVSGDVILFCFHAICL
jgi:hypothetical protein